MSTQAVALPPPLVRPTRHPLRWMWNHAKLLVAILVLAHLGTLIIVGLYYGIFETWRPITRAWHHLVPDNYTRHMIRDVGEGLLGGTLAQLVVWNHYRHRVLRAESEEAKRNRLDRLEIALHIPNIKSPRRLRGWQLAISPLLVLVYAVPGFAVALGVSELVHAHLAAVSHLGPHTAVWDRVRTIWTTSWDKKLVGFGASLFFGRRPMRKVYDDVQLWFASKRVAAGKGVRFWQTPTYQARINDLRSREAQSREIDLHSDRWLSVLLGLAVPVGLALAGFGYYVLGYIAKQ